MTIEERFAQLERRTHALFALTDADIAAFRAGLNIGQASESPAAFQRAVAEFREALSLLRKAAINFGREGGEA